ncbi:MAG: hypothetical protein SPL47_00245 [Bacteroidales bacterium]|nr:hypothetical protein [Bacteroidales bacterium]
MINNDGQFEFDVGKQQKSNGYALYNKCDMCFSSKIAFSIFLRIDNFFLPWLLPNPRHQACQEVSGWQKSRSPAFRKIVYLFPAAHHSKGCRDGYIDDVDRGVKHPSLHARVLDF